MLSYPCGFRSPYYENAAPIWRFPRKRRRAGAYSHAVSTITTTGPQASQRVSTVHTDDPGITAGLRESIWRDPEFDQLDEIKMNHEIDFDKNRHDSTPCTPSDLARSFSKKVKLSDSGITKHALVNRLPIEVLVNIFLATPCDHIYDRWERRPAHSGGVPRMAFHEGSSADPMILSQVCRQWREVTTSSPTLWSSIYILSSDKGQPVPLLKCWLQRSGNNPLSIRFVESVVGHAAHDDSLPFPQSIFTKDIIPLLVAEAHRWRAIDFTFSRQVSPVLSNIALDSFPLLDTASITSRRATNQAFAGVETLDKVWRAVHSSPSFRSGCWELEYLDQRLREVPWQQLTTINVTMTADALMQILPLCHNLVNLQYTDPFFAYSDGTLPSHIRSSEPGELIPEEKITLAGLRHLSIKMDRPSNTILDRLILPSLSSYTVQLYKDSEEHPHVSSFVDLLDRSGCQLEEFTYNDTEANAEDAIVEILSSPHMASLIHLKLLPRTTNVLMDFLKRTEDHRNILPRLERLYLGFCSTRGGALSAMVLSRHWSAVEELASIRAIEVGRWDGHPIDLECFYSLSEEGIFIGVS
ncbi:hypothetical protein C0991_007834 [Blastosporella zonata]|nr:hypothetical protein C0991_007834 [Blastosporella zonata]